MRAAQRCTQHQACDLYGRCVKKISQKCPRSVSPERCTVLTGRAAAGAAQIVVQGISWKAREEQLRELFGEIGEIESASVVMGRDGRSRVRSRRALHIPWPCAEW